MAERLRSSSESVVVRFPVGGTPLDYEEFPAWQVVGINESSEIVVRLLRIQIRRNRYTTISVAKIGANGEVLWQANANEAPSAGDLNNMGDVVGYLDGTTGSPYLMQEGDPNTAGDELFLDIRDLIIEDSDPDRIFRDSPVVANDLVSDRDSTDHLFITRFCCSRISHRQVSVCQ